jgi:hypothetical protein
MIFLITAVIYVLLLSKFIFFTTKNEDIEDLLFFLLKVMTFVFSIAIIVFTIQIKKAILLKEEIEEMSIFVDNKFLIYSKAELHSLEHNAFSGLLIRKFFTNEED